LDLSSGEFGDRGFFSSRQLDAGPLVRTLLVLSEFRTLEMLHRFDRGFYPKRMDEVESPIKGWVDGLRRRERKDGRRCKVAEVGGPWVELEGGWSELEGRGGG